MAITKLHSTVEVSATPELLAKIFTEMSDEGQAEFFNGLAIQWTDLDWDFQSTYIRSHLTDRANDFIRTLGGL